jgi:hypothetical protein
MNHYLYKITVGGKSYIGVSVNTTQRFEAHCKSRYLIGIAIREWGRALADFRVLACGRETREKMSFAQLGEKNHQWGKSASVETLAKLSAVHKGKPWTVARRAAQTKEVSARISLAQHSRAHKPHSIETRLKLSQSALRRKRAENGCWV